MNITMVTMTGIICLTLIMITAMSNKKEKKKEQEEDKTIRLRDRK